MKTMKKFLTILFLFVLFSCSTNGVNTISEKKLDIENDTINSQTDKIEKKSEIKKLLNESVLADWKLNANYLNAEKHILVDASGNENNLELKKGAIDKIIFSDKSISGEGSVEFQGNAEVEFITVKNAPINYEDFRAGYTIEVLYYFPTDWSQVNAWMGILQREAGLIKRNYMAVSSCKQVQFCYTNADGKITRNAAWSLSMDKGGTWYHIAVINDGKKTQVFLNGAPDFEKPTDLNMQGLYCKGGKRFKIGSAPNGLQTKYTKGNIERVRISNTALPKEAWLVPNPEKLMGNYGCNELYTLKSQDNYNFVFVPDTQNTIKFMPDVMERAVKGTLENADARNIKAVVLLGDIVQDPDSKEQFKDASRIFGLISESNIPFLRTPGNHDTPLKYTHSDHNHNKKARAYDDKYYSKYFAYNDSDNMTSIAPSKRSAAKLVKAGSFEYLIITLSITDFNENDEKAWFQLLLNENKDKPTIIASHIIIDCSDTEPSKTKLADAFGKKLYERIKNHDQVFMLVSGHYHGAGWNIVQNAKRNDIITILADYQFGYNGGNAFFKYAEFDEVENKIYLRTYSDASASLPKSEKTFFDVNFLSGAGNDDTISFDFAVLKERLAIKE